MNVGFGKHGGMSVGTLVLKEPNYVEWILQQQNPSGQMVRVQAEVQRLIDLFDSKPFQTRKCGGCGKPATRCSVYRDNVHSLCWWCGSCDPYQTGATDGKLELVSTYQGALMGASGFSVGFFIERDRDRVLRGGRTRRS